MDYDFFNNSMYFGKTNYSPYALIAKLVLIDYVARLDGDGYLSKIAQAYLTTIEDRDSGNVVNFIKENFEKCKNTVDEATYNKTNQQNTCPHKIKGCPCAYDAFQRRDAVLKTLPTVYNEIIEWINKYAKTYLHPTTVIIGDIKIEYDNSNFRKKLSIFSIVPDDHGEKKAEKEAPNVLTNANDIEQELTKMIKQMKDKSDKSETNDIKNKSKIDKLEEMYKEFKKDCQSPLHQYMEHMDIILKAQAQAQEDKRRKEKGINYFLGKDTSNRKKDIVKETYEKGNENNDVEQIENPYIESREGNVVFMSRSNCKNKRPGIFIHNNRRMQHK